LHVAGVKYVLLKQGKRGARVSGPGFSALAPGFAVEAVDSTGAGDVFAGAFLAAWLRGQSVTEAAQFANAAAALSVMEVGSVAGVRDFKQTLTWMRQAQSSGPRA
jgi:ribokinase